MAQTTTAKEAPAMPKSNPTHSASQYPLPNGTVLAAHDTVIVGITDSAYKCQVPGDDGYTFVPFGHVHDFAPATPLVVFG